MGEVQIQTHQDPILAHSPRPIIAQKQKQHYQQQQPVIIPSSMVDLHQIQNQEAIGNDHSHVIEPTDLFSALHLSSSANRRRHPPCTATTVANNNNNSSTKRRSPPSSTAVERSAKKLFCDQEDLTNHGFSAISLPLSLGNSGKVLRRCVSDHYNPPEHTTPPAARGSGLPPLPPKFTRCLSDVTPSPAKRSLSSEETTPDSLRLRRMKDRLRGMKQWWDEVMKEEEERGGEEEEEECGPVTPVAEDGKNLSQDHLGGDSEEAVSVEWAEKCVSLTFRCPCGKGYEVLISANNCYYKLL